MEQLEFMINGGETRRFHTWPILREDRVDSHSWRVALLYSMMAGHDGTPETGGISVSGLMTALAHDMPEHKVGDLPAPAKRNMPDLADGRTFRAAWGEMEEEMLDAQGWNWAPMCSEHDKRWLKLADAMDGALYCIRERMMGNRLVVVPFANFRSYIREVSAPRDEVPVNGELMEHQIIDYIDDMWEQANG